MPRSLWILLPVLMLLAVDACGAEATSPTSLVAVSSQGPRTLQELQRLPVELVSYDPDTGITYLIVDQSGRYLLQSRGYAVSTLQTDATAGLKRLQGMEDLGLYHTYEEMVAELESLTANYPDLAALVVIGESYERRPIYALKISDAPEVEDPTEPDVLIVGNHHARELMSVEVPLHVAQHLLTFAARDPAIGDLVNNREIWIVPMLNPDGHVHQEITQGYPGWRKNRRVNGDGTYGVDLNRNYSYKWGLDNEGSSPESFSEIYRGAAAFSEPETRVMRAFVEAHDFVISLSYHSFGELLLYPWGWTAQQTTADHAVFVALADSMVRDNRYRPGNPVNGAIYLVNGEFDDYMYGEVNARKPRQTFAFTVELNAARDGGFWPSDALIAPTCEKLLSLNLYAIRVASDNLRSILPPPPPLLSLYQHEEEPWRLDLSWSLAADPVNPVDHYEVFEINPAGKAAANSAPPVELHSSGRAILARQIQLPTRGQVTLRLATQLHGLWDYVYVEARPHGSDNWIALQGERTSSDSPTGQNSGHGLSLSLRDDRLSFDASPLGAGPLDLSIRLAAHPQSPQPAYVRAGLDIVRTFGESRRVLADDIHDTQYTVLAENTGLYAYGVTAVDNLGHRSDSEPIFVSIRSVTDVAVQDIALQTVGDQLRLQWQVTSQTPARFEAWSRALQPGETPGAAYEEWTSGKWQRVASVAVRHAGRQELQWASSASRSAVLLMGNDSDGRRLWGPWIASTPMRTALYPAVPNPFNPNTRLRFELATGGSVQLSIIGVDGRRVRQLTAGTRLAGIHQLVWDGRDDAGRPVASGVYIAQLRLPGSSLTQRLVLLR